MSQARANDPRYSFEAVSRTPTSPVASSIKTSASAVRILFQLGLARCGATKFENDGSASKSRTVVCAVKSAAKKPKWKLGLPATVWAKAVFNAALSGQLQYMQWCNSATGGCSS